MKIKLKKAKNKTMTEQVYEKLEDLIVFCEIEPGIYFLIDPLEFTKIRFDFFFKKLFIERLFIFRFAIWFDKKYLNLKDFE